MIDSTPSFGRTVAIGVALVAVLFLFFQAQPAPSISAWGGSSAGGISGQAQPLSGQAQPWGGGDAPSGSPLRSPRTVMTQGYGVGTHAPADVWGAVDLAIDANGDGSADRDATLNTPIYATHSGVVRLDANTYPAGNHIWVTGAHFKTGYSHLSSFAVPDGQQVSAGDLIGYVGTTGLSSGPHLDYQVWKDGVNVNPLDYGATTSP